MEIKAGTSYDNAMKDLVDELSKREIDIHKTFREALEKNFGVNLTNMMLGKTPTEVPMFAKMENSPYDYVKYDEKAVNNQAILKRQFEEIDHLLSVFYAGSPSAGRAIALARTKLEEAYMWCGKATRDDQISRNGSAQLQEERSPLPPEGGWTKALSDDEAHESAD